MLHDALPIDVSHITPLHMLQFPVGHFLPLSNAQQVTKITKVFSNKRTHRPWAPQQWKHDILGGKQHQTRRLLECNMSSWGKRRYIPWESPRYLCFISNWRLHTSMSLQISANQIKSKYNQDKLLYMSNYEFACSCLLTISIKSAAVAPTHRPRVLLARFDSCMTAIFTTRCAFSSSSHKDWSKTFLITSKAPLSENDSTAITIQCMGECKKSKLGRNYVPVSSSNFHSEWQPEFPDHLPVNPASRCFLLFSCVPFTSSASSVCIRVHPPPPALVESPSCGVDFLSSIALSSPIHALGYTWHDHWKSLESAMIASSKSKHSSTTMPDIYSFWVPTCRRKTLQLVLKHHVMVEHVRTLIWLQILWKSAFHFLSYIQTITVIVITHTYSTMTKKQGK